MAPDLRSSLALLGCLLPAVASAQQGDADAPPIPELQEQLEQGAALSSSADWGALLTLWAEAAAIGSGERGPFPFDRAGKESLLAQLEASKARVDALVAQGLINAAEAGLLKADVDTMTAAVSKKRPTEMEMATCYRPMMPMPARDSRLRLEARLPLLEQLAAEGVLHPEVVERVLQQVEADIAGVKSGGGRPMEPAERAQTEKAGAAAQALVETIRAKLEEPQ